MRKISVGPKSDGPEKKRKKDGMTFKAYAKF